MSSGAESRRRPAASESFRSPRNRCCPMLAPGDQSAGARSSGHGDSREARQSMRAEMVNTNTRVPETRVTGPMPLLHGRSPIPSPRDSFPAPKPGRSYLPRHRPGPLLKPLRQEINPGPPGSNLIRLEEGRLSWKLHAGAAPSRRSGPRPWPSQPVPQAQAAAAPRQRSGVDRQPAPCGDVGEEIHQAEHGGCRH